MEKYVCIHGHFYQPPRENPWLEDVELQDSAYPYHDWNDKITQECYKQNAASRILGPDKKIIEIVNNYSRISFDFGPTLLSWLERHEPDVYKSVLDADRKSMEYFGGHGAAIAQAYNHIIMPLANRRDKETQVIWGIEDFRRHFRREPEGMWLPETAVDSETLDILAEHGIKFTILAPHQARRIREIGAESWTIIEKENIDTTKPYLCRLNSGRKINLFFYEGQTARDIIDGRLLQNGEVFAKRMAWIFKENQEPAQLAHIATDGETYGHHFRHTDMALAYCLHNIQSRNLAAITIYGQYLEKFPPTREVDIYENSSWSCRHGVERWRSNCGCNYGKFPSGKQQWRGPLRDAMDWLRDRLAILYENKMSLYVSDPWDLRDHYIEVINNRSAENVEKFLLRYSGRELEFHEKTEMLKLLEMQRNGLLMYTSCGWFFDDICGIEAVQLMLYAGRAIQLAKEIDGMDLEPGYKNILEKAPTNTSQYADGKQAYDALAKSCSVDLNRVGAHLAISSVFDEYPDKIDVYCYSANIDLYDRADAGIQTLAIGRATVQSKIVLEKHSIDFVVLHYGDHNLTCAVNLRMPDDVFYSMRDKMRNAFAKGDMTEIMRTMNVSFAGNSYSLWHLFKDQQRKILNELLQTTWQEIEASFRHIYEHNYTIIQIMRGMNMPLPRAMAVPLEYILNHDLTGLIKSDKSNLRKLKSLVDEATKLSLQLDTASLRYEASRKINRCMDKIKNSPDDIKTLELVDRTVETLLTLTSDLDLQHAQNILFALSRQMYPDKVKKTESGDKSAKKWIDTISRLAQHLGVKI